MFLEVEVQETGQIKVNEIVDTEFKMKEGVSS